MHLICWPEHMFICVIKNSTMALYQHKLLIGGIGDDAHSIGIGLLELGFREAGFFVKNLGIRNTIEHFFELIHDFDIILVSNKNGHAELYLQNFPNLLQDYSLYNNDIKLWYLGGSLSVSESDFQVKKKWLQAGFTNVYPKPIVFQEVLHDISRDVHRFDIKKKHIVLSDKEPKVKIPAIAYEGIINRKLTKEELLRERTRVLQEWSTGKEVITAPLMPLDKNRILDNLLWHNKISGKIPLFQPRTGVADLQEQIGILKFLEIAGCSISSVQLDSASRSRFYDKAVDGLAISKERKASMLNGFPIPVHGVSGVQKLISSLNTPFQLRGGGPDHRFTYEIALKSGVSAVEGGFICYLLPYDKLCSPIESFRNWQYVDRLCAWYEEQYGILINREYFGVLTASLIEPSLAIVVNVIQSLLSAQQGVKSITVGYAEQGNRSQDIAAVKVMEEMVTYYLNLFRFYDCKVTTVFHQYMSAFPSDYEKAVDLIFNSSITATLAGATKVMVKTAVEAIRIPDKYENVKALQLCQKAALFARETKVSHQQIEVEGNMLRKEVKQMINAILELGNNSFAIGAIRAIEYGILDIPWSPNNFNNNKVMGIRDIDGAVRFLNFGNLPFNEEVKAWHHEKVHMRKTMERETSLFSLLEKDLSRIWKNDYKKWPLDNTYIN